MKPKYSDNAKLCYVDADSFIMHIKTKYFFKDIAIILKKDLIHQIMKSMDHYLQEKNYKSDRRKDYDRICCFKTKGIFLLNG